MFFQCVFGLLARSHVRLDTVPDSPPIRKPPRAGVEVDPANLAIRSPHPDFDIKVGEIAFAARFGFEETVRMFRQNLTV